MSDGDSKSGAEGGEEKKPLIEYPTTYAFKVMGRQEPGFVDYVRNLFKRLMGTEIAHDSVREQPSSKGTYVSVTVEVYLLSEEHRRTIYEALHKERRIVYYL